MKQLKLFFLCFWIIIGLSSCAFHRLNVNGVAYHSVRAVNPMSESDIPSDAKIVIICDIARNGDVSVEVVNKTDKVLVIDRTKSFFVDREGNSIPYYDPTINVSTISHTTGGAVGSSVNLGGIANTSTSSVLNAVSVNSNRSLSSSTSNTTYYVDQPMLSIAPHGKAPMGRIFNEKYFDADLLKDMIQYLEPTLLSEFYEPENSFSSCYVTVSFSFDNGNTYDVLEVGMYTNTLIVSKVVKKGHVNDALREIYSTKPDLFDENWYMLIFPYHNFDMGTNFNDVTSKTYAWKGVRNTFINFK